MYTYEKLSNYSLVLLNGVPWARISNGRIINDEDDPESWQYERTSEENAKAVCDALNAVNQD